MEEDENRSPSPDMALRCCIFPKIVRRSWRKWLLTSVMFTTFIMLFSNNGGLSFNKGRTLFFGDSKTNNVPRHLDLSDLNNLVKRDTPDSESEENNNKNSFEIVTWQKPFSDKYKPINKLSSRNFLGTTDNRVVRQDIQTVENEKKLQERKHILGIFQENTDRITPEPKSNQQNGQLELQKDFQTKPPLKSFQASNHNKPESQQTRREKIKSFLSSKSNLSKKEKIAAIEEVYAKRMKRLKEKDATNEKNTANENEMLQPSDSIKDRETLIGSLNKEVDSKKFAPFSNYESDKRSLVDYSKEEFRKQEGSSSQNAQNPTSSESTDSLVSSSLNNKGGETVYLKKDQSSQKFEVFQKTPSAKDISKLGNASDRTSEGEVKKTSLDSNSLSKLTREEVVATRKEKLKLILSKAKEKRLREKKERQEKVKKLLVLKLKEKLSKNRESNKKAPEKLSLPYKQESASQIVNRAIALNKLRGMQQQAAKVAEEVNESRLPTLYELYSHGHIQTGLTVDSKEFLLNGKPIRIMSGTIHYFRVLPAYWRDRLRKLRAAGFNTITTDVPWNFHQPFKSTMDFSSSWRNIRRFISTAKEEDLFVILRVGPYISAEWDFGGLPHWLLQEEEIKFRTPQTLFFKPVSEYLKMLGKLLVDLQWSKKNGAQPLLAIQIENEFLIVSVMADRDKRYLMSLKNIMVDAGLSDVLYVMTNPANQICKERLVPGIFQAVSFSGDPTFPFFMLTHTQPDTPKLVMTFQTGGFDRFTDKNHRTDDIQEFRTNLEWILSNGSSVNLYMFHGGTTFGFMNGGSRFQKESFYKPGVNSYDYDAPLTEAGDYTKKYWAAQALAKTYRVGPEIWNPEPPPETKKKAYPNLQIQHYLSFDDIVSMLPAPAPQFNPKPMEFLDLHDGSGQGYGFILYRKESVILNPYSVLKINGIIRDIVYILIDGKLISSPLTSVSNINSAGYWIQRNPQFDISGDGAEHRVDLLVESMGRDNIEMSNGKKGIRGTVMLDEAPLNYWRVYPIELSANWIKKIPHWRQFHVGTPITSPGLYRTNLRISDKPSDTFLNPFNKRNKWTKGQIFINAFNLGRYWDIGPTQTSYIPAPLLRTGDNEILLFEIYKPGNFLSFQDAPSLG